MTYHIRDCNFHNHTFDKDSSKAVKKIAEALQENAKSLGILAASISVKDAGPTALMIINEPKSERVSPAFSASDLIDAAESGEGGEDETP